MPSKLLEGRIALITGGGRGIGRAIAIGYASEGARVAVCSRTGAEVEETASIIKERGGEALAIAADLTVEAEAQRCVKEVEADLGGLDLAFLNAGGNVGSSDPVEHSDFADWARTIEINLHTAFLVAKASIPLLRKSANGQIITMGSGLGRRPGQGSSAYSAAKAGLWMLTQSLSVELAESGITVNELVPGPVRSIIPEGESFEPYLIKEGDWKNEWVKRAEDVVPMALFLASQGKHGPTGQSFALNRRLL